MEIMIFFLMTPPISILLSLLGEEPKSCNFPNYVKGPDGLIPELGKVQKIPFSVVM
jgi:hypothetical protein